MRPNHVHLHVRDLEASRAFYRGWFKLSDGPDFGEGLLFLRSADGFDLALSLDPEPESLPEWFHWGFKAEDRSKVREAYQRMVAQGVSITRELLEDDEIVSFRCADPDGHNIEIYWQP